MIAYSRIALGTDQGRLLFPALAPLGLLIAAGWAGLLPTRPSARQALATTLSGAGVLALAAALALHFGVRMPFAPPVPPGRELLTATAIVPVAFGNGPTLTGVERVGRGDEVVLYWRADRPLAQDYRSVLRLVNAEGGLLWEWRRSPGSGRFATDRWPAGRDVRDVYTVPPDLLERAAWLEVGVYDFATGQWEMAATPEREVQFFRLETPQ
jgi:hypothetical protein